MRRFLALAMVVLLASPLWPQDSGDKAAEILKKIDAALKKESDRTREEILDLVRQELRGARGTAPSDPAPVRPAAAAGTAEKAKGLVSAELLRRHATFLASDDLEGRCAGYPGCDKAAEYIADVFKKSGLKPAGENGTYFQKFRVAGKDTKNVIGLIEGTDPQLKDEYVVVGAHYDHVGTADTRDFGRMGGKGDDQIWNGADDNGSGTTCVLGLAKLFGEGGLAAKRTLVFMCFSGEEAGLVGSRWYTNHPLGPIDKHAFMLNLDMVGRNPSKAMEIHGVGSGEGGVIRKTVERAVAASGLKAKLNDEVTLVGGDSDHSSFAAKSVPYAFFFSGFHADYHRPSDHADKLAYDNMIKVVNTSTDILLEMANLDEKPKFVGRQKRGLNIPDLDPAAPPPRRLGVTVQELDDADCDGLKLEAGQGGLRVDAVQGGSAAEGAGVKVGDVVLSVAGAPLPRGATRDELRKVLTDKVRPGKEVEIVVLRKGERVSLKAKWTE